MGFARGAGPALALLLLAICAHADLLQPVERLEVAPGICPSLDIRNTPDQLMQLRGCRIIEGNLNIVLFERTNASSFTHMSFPELREVTGFVIIYRIKGILNLGDMFPNLAVVRGIELFKDFALIVFDNENLRSLSFYSLSKIERGAVRIQNNDQLCYTDTVDWSRIMNDDPENNVIRNNYDIRLCGGCLNAKNRKEDLRRHSNAQCPVDNKGRILCWDDNNCQNVCAQKCSDSGCLSNGTCCHKSCLGGCEQNPKNCHVCRNFSAGYGAERTCVERCPVGTYKLFRRCVSEQECRMMKPPVPYGSNNLNVVHITPAPKKYKILNGACIYRCPSGYTEVEDGDNSLCKPCPRDGCMRECVGGVIDSLTAAEQYQGCTNVKGDLVISLRALGGIATLERSLGDIRQIEGSLKVTRSYPLVSLMFLKNLRVITGNTNDENKPWALYVFNNPNLELLWDWSSHDNITITSGKLFIHFNPKLCYNKLLSLKHMIPNGTFTENDISKDNNGDQASCYPDTLKVEVQTVKRDLVVLKWDMYCMDDIRKLLGYSIYYIATEQNVTLYGQRDACSDSWNVIDVPANDVVKNQTDPKTNVDDILKNECDQFQPVFRMISQLTPYTRYAFYVKTYTTLQDKKGAVSPILYFRTLPGKPSPPLALSVETVNPHSMIVKWSPPAMSNGTIVLYHVVIQANSYNKPKILSANIDYCGRPSALSNMIPVRSEPREAAPEEAVTGDVRNGTCACDAMEPRAPVRFNSLDEMQRAESIAFENGLQNVIYQSKSKKNKKPTTRTAAQQRVKRSVDDTLNSMLVIVSKNDDPKPGDNYTNSTEDGYVKTLYYELDGATRSLTVSNMRHFTWYTVSVWACRARSENETRTDYNETWCSDRAYNNFRTPELMDVDRVSGVRATLLPSNKTSPEVNVTWTPPKNPNGFVVAYNVHHARVEENNQGQEMGMQSCITADDFEASGHGFLLRKLTPGNYSVRVTPVTVSGAGNVSADVYVLIPERPANSGTQWVYGVVGGCVALLLLVLGGVWCARRELLPPPEGSKLIASVNPEYVSSLYVPDEWEVPRENIKFIKELGQGSFGMVYEGLGKNIVKGKSETRCAVKTVNEHATDRERIEFLKEASVMKAFDTHHVVRLLGVVSRGQPTLVVMELMECGDLKTYLRSHRPDTDSSLPPKANPDNPPPTLQNILQMAIEIADGMAYLSAKKFVHRDLAARNCMVAGDLTVKVGDFGMTRDIYETDYYRKGTKGLLPVRWMSPESLKDGVFSSHTDVWSYGVVLWEMATLAMQPYQGLSNEQVVRYVGEGGVMERPEHCPDRLYELMRACWAHRPDARPTFLRLVADLAPTAAPYFRHRSFFHTPQGQEFYAMQNVVQDEEQEMPEEVSVGAVATGSGSNLFGVSGRLASWVRELSSLRSRGSPDDAAAEPLQPLKAGSNGVPLAPPPGAARARSHAPAPAPAPAAARSPHAPGC